METEIFKQIKDAELKSDEIVNRAKIEAERILREGTLNANTKLADGKDEIINDNNKKLEEFKEKIKSIHEAKNAELDDAVDGLKATASKNMNLAVNLIIEKFNDTVKC